MKKFDVVINENLRKKVSILGENKKDVLAKVNKMFSSGAIEVAIEDIEKREIIITDEEEIQSEYLQKIIEPDKNALICELSKNQYYLYEDGRYSCFYIGALKIDEDKIMITQIYYTDDCPLEENEKLFYFKSFRGYSVIDYSKYKTCTIKELFMKEKELYESYELNKDKKDNDYIVVETKRPFQELTVKELYEIHNQELTIKEEKVIIHEDE